MYDGNENENYDIILDGVIKVDVPTDEDTANEIATEFNDFLESDDSCGDYIGEFKLDLNERVITLNLYEFNSNNTEPIKSIDYDF